MALPAAQATAESVITYSLITVVWGMFGEFAASTLAGDAI
jgi:hypothetical protein